LLSSDDISEIIPSRVEMVTPDGMITREWFLFFCDLFLSTASIAGSVNDVALVANDAGMLFQDDPVSQVSPSLSSSIDDIYGMMGDHDLSFVQSIAEPARPTFGASSSFVEQTAPSTSSIYTVQFENKQLSDGVDMQADNVTILSSGTYCVDYTLRINDVGDVDSWIEVNDVPVPGTLVTEVVVVMVSNISNYGIISVNSGDVVKVKWSSTSTNQTLRNVASTTLRPSAPSATIKIRKI
jgi:hypothetical protein